MKFPAALKLVVVTIVVAISCTLLPGTASAAEAPDSFYKCWYRGSFGGLPFCPAKEDQVKSNAFGPGRRVVLRQIAVVYATDSAVFVAQPRHYECGPDGCAWYVRPIALDWSGRHRPKVDAFVDLYGITTADGSLTPVGFVNKGVCAFDDWDSCLPH